MNKEGPVTLAYLVALGMVAVSLIGIAGLGLVALWRWVV
jgi:hypothetical protein